MEIYSETGYLIVMDPHYFQLGKEEEISAVNFLADPRTAAQQLERKLFPDGGEEKIGLIILKDGPGKYKFDKMQVSFWDVEEKNMANRTIFGVELGSFIIFDIKYISEIVANFDKFEFEKIGDKAYFEEMNQKLSDHGNAIIWTQSHVGIGDGWHELKWQAFEKC